MLLNMSTEKLWAETRSGQNEHFVPFAVTVNARQKLTCNFSSSF